MLAEFNRPNQSICHRPIQMPGRCAKASEDFLAGDPDGLPLVLHLVNTFVTALVIYHIHKYMSIYTIVCIMENSGTRLREIQKIFRETQKAMANKIGIHFNTLQNYQSGKRLPDGKVLEDVCSVYGVSPEWLLTGRGEIVGGSSSVIGSLSVKESAFILQRVAGLVKERRDRLLKITAVMEDVEKRDRREELLQENLGKEGLMASRLEKLAAAFRKMDEIEWKIITQYGDLKAEVEENEGSGEGEQEPITVGKKKKKTKSLVPSVIQEKRVAKERAITAEHLKFSKEYHDALEEYENEWKKLLVAPDVQ